MSLVSIIIPCYNAADSIADAISSALAQQRVEFEVIVVDDGSTDDSRNVIAQFGSKVRSKFGPNRGAPAARNLGLGMAAGTWIQFLDADDLLKPDCVASKLDFAEKIQAVNIIPCCRVVPREGDEGYFPEQMFLEEYSLETLFSIGPPQTSAPLHRRSSLETIGGFREELVCCQETDLHLRLAVTQGAHFAVSPRVGVELRRLGQSISSNWSPAKELVLVGVIERAANEANENNVLSNSLSKAIAQRLQISARYLWRNGQKNEARATNRLARSYSKGWADIYPQPKRVFVKTFGFRFSSWVDEQLRRKIVFFKNGD